MANVGGDSGLAGAVGKIAAVVLALAGLVTALDALVQKSQAFSCHLSLAFPWCEGTVEPKTEPAPGECRNDMTVVEYDKCVEQLRNGQDRP